MSYTGFVNITQYECNMPISVARPSPNENVSGITLVILILVQSVLLISKVPWSTNNVCKNQRSWNKIMCGFSVNLTLRGIMTF